MFSIASFSSLLPCHYKWVQVIRRGNLWVEKIEHFPSAALCCFAALLLCFYSSPSQSSSDSPLVRAGQLQGRPGGCYPTNGVKDFLSYCVSHCMLSLKWCEMPRFRYPRTTVTIPTSQGTVLSTNGLVWNVNHRRAAPRVCSTPDESLPGRPVHAWSGLIIIVITVIIVIIVTRPKQAYDQQGLAGFWG